VVIKRSMKDSSDVLVVGGGPAGLASALALRQRGATVTVADAMKPPIDKACGEGLMPDSLHDLGLLGVELSPEDGAAFEGIRFVDHGYGNLGTDSVATALFPSGFGIGLRRQSLHARLVRQAQAEGVRLRWESHVRLTGVDDVSVAGQPFRYGWLIGADGQGSRVRRWAGLERGSIVSRRYGFRRHFPVEPWSPYVEVHWSKRGQAYVTPTGPNEVCVAGVVRDAHCRLDTLLAEMPRLRERLAGGKAPDGREEDLERERGAVTLTRRLRRVAHSTVALVGDASGSADAITGEGMGMSFRQALLLAECLELGDLERYDRLHPEIMRLPQTMARVMLGMDRSKVFRGRAIAMLGAEPTIFARMLGVHLGAESFPRFLAAKGFEVAWRLAMAGAAVGELEWRG